MARLRAQLEKGEALRQNLEYELSKLKREMNQDQHQAIQREQLLSQVNESLKGRSFLVLLGKDRVHHQKR